MIKPTIGRIVHFHPGHDHPGFVSMVEGVHAAIICDVHSDTRVTLCVFDSNGIPYQADNAYLLSDEPSADIPMAVVTGEAGYAEWMDYQKGQAAKTEALEEQLADTDAGDAA